MSTSASNSRSRGWLFGPVPDLLLGCGAIYLLVAALQLSTGDLLARWVPGGVLILLFSLPHYGATLLRVYDSSSDRSRYRFFALHATVALVAVFALSLHSVLLGSLVLTLYLTWSPWHYTGQNYGIGLMMLARRGVDVGAGTKRWLHGSFVACYALTFVAMHGAQPEGTYAPVSADAARIAMMPLGIPPSLATPILWALAGTYLLTLGVSVARLLRAGSALAIGPAVLLFATQAVWFAIPVMLRMSGEVAGGAGAAGPFSAYGFLWIASAHAVQYLWITVYYATSSAGRSGKARFLGRAALAGFAVWVLPGLIFAPGLLGAMPYDSGLALLIAAVVNLHHFVLDGVIWKLRDSRVAGVLLRPASPGDAARTESGASSLRRALAWVGAACVAIACFGFWESEFGYRRAIAAGDLGRAEQAIERFSWIARDGAAKRVEVAREYGRSGDYARASFQLERAVAIERSAEAHDLLGLVREHQGRMQEARAEYEAALAIDPAKESALLNRARVDIEIGNPADAISALEGIADRDPTNERARAMLVRARLALRAQAGSSALQ